MTTRVMSAPVDPRAAQRDARHILSGRQFHAASTPRPLRRPLDWLGHRLADIGDWLGRQFSRAPLAVWLVIASFAIIVAVTFAVTKVRANRGRADARHRSHRSEPEDRETADELERAAEAAEGRGDLDQALRLRFRAGLHRLGDRGAIRYRPSVTTSEVRRTLGSETFDDLARVFEEVAYGGREADAPDLDAARREWPRVVTTARQRPDR